MNNSFSLQQVSQTGNLDSNLISRQYKLKLMAKFMQIKFENPKLKQSEIANQLSYTSSNLQRYRNDINRLSFSRIQPNITKKRTKMVLNRKFDKNSLREIDLKRPQMNQNNLAKPDTNTESINKRASIKKNQNIVKAGSMHGNIETNDKYLDENLHKNDV